jgi:outer membrane lipoprotein-sorting protein
MAAERYQRVAILPCMSVLRTISSRRLLAAIAGLVLAIIGGTAIAVAASSGGPVPPPKPLARAIHFALTAQSVPGIDARVTFTNHLIDSSDIQGGDPLLKGAHGRLWVSNDHRIRLELQSDNGDAQAVLTNGRFWVYDRARNTIYEGKLPAGTAKHKTQHKRAEKIPSVAKIQSELRKAARHLLISAANPGDTGGQASYSVQTSPKQHPGLLGGVRLAWDAVRGIPLSFGVYARGDSSPVLELKVDKIHYKSIHSSIFAISPPRGAKVVKVSTPSSKAGPRGKHVHMHGKPVAGVRSVARSLSFKLAAPGILAGRSRSDVRLLGAKRDAGALVTYGQGLDGIAVIEQQAKSASGASSKTAGDGSGGDQRVTLPTVSINGTTGQEIKTPLGTIVRFTRAGVTYTVLGSVPAATAQAAARGL